MLGNFRTPGEVRKLALEMSALLFDHCGEGPFGDEQVLDKARQHQLFGEFLELSGGPGQLQTIAQYRWAESGFPVVSLGEKFAAALLVTSASLEAVQAVMPPFPAFFLEVPVGLIRCRDHEGKPDDVLAAYVMRYHHRGRGLDNAWAYCTCSAKGTALYRFGCTSEELLPPELVGDLSIDAFDAFAGELTGVDERAMAMMGRLIVNTCLAFSDPTNVRPPKETRVRHRLSL